NAAWETAVQDRLDRTVKSLESLFGAGTPAQKRSAAEALGALVRVSSLGPQPNRAVVDSGKRSAPVLGKALGDADAGVRAAGLSALTQVAQSLADLIRLPDPTEEPGKLTDLWARGEEDYKTFLPLTEALAAQVPAVGRVVLDPDP